MDDKELTSAAYSLHFKHIVRAQNNDNELLNKVQKLNNYNIKFFCGGSKSYDLIVKHNKIVMPKPLQKHIVQWYHTQLCHPGETRTKQTIAQHFYWKNLQQIMHKVWQKSVQRVS